MKVIVCGAGQVGFNIARQLAAEQNDVTVIDTSPELIARVNEALDVQAMVGYASHPDVLERAGARDTDMIVAVTYADEINMIACQVAHAIFNVPTKIARIRAQTYLYPEWQKLFGSDRLGIDVVISPEIEVARAVIRRIEVPGASDVASFADGLVRVISVFIAEDCPIRDTPLRQLTELFPDLHIRVMGIIRAGETLVPAPEDTMIAGDEVYFAVDAAHVTRAMASFGYEEREARSVVIGGGGNIGLLLAKQFEAEHPNVRVKLIEFNKARAEEIADQLVNATVINGDLLDRTILEEAGIKDTEAIIAVTDDDQVNILASLIAKREGCQSAIALINELSYGPLIHSLGIDVVINPRASTVSTILQFIRRGRIRRLYSLADGVAEIIEGEVLPTSNLAGTTVRESKLAHVVIGALVRGDDVITPKGDTVIQPSDKVIVFALKDVVKKVERMLSVRPDSF
jgi:trk system potassium uptake protein TrkA